jgi:hypothetical protein
MRRRSNPSTDAWWLFGIVAGAGALIAGVAYAASGSGSAFSGMPVTPAPTGGATTTPPTATTPAPTTAPAPQTIALDGSANGTTVQAKVGDTISIMLGGNNLPWSYSLPLPSGVTQGAETTSAPSKAIKATQTDLFSVVSAGTSVIKANDTGMGQFSVTVVVT